MSTNEGQVKDTWGDEGSPSSTSSLPGYPVWAFQSGYPQTPVSVLSPQAWSGWRHVPYMLHLYESLCSSFCVALTLCIYLPGI